ncbi:hypothetical protein FBZ82_12613 [Azospirillum brasilense]|uniref:Uncharacterized protein n=1 Tax=Azospirillum brasilense TaxID=192 RepID=A0A560AG11_AZOBR|nr:hypothetical protein [Azospirillum brasilense]TWA59252.1 hypothetical protein FBZ82_12613 [Azospirillum brasilense]
MGKVSRRTVLAGAAGALAAPAAVACPTLNDDAPLLDLCRRWREMEPVIARLSDEHIALHRLAPSRAWTPEEMKAHRIQNDADRTRFVSVKEIEQNDIWDSPRRAIREFDEQDDGVTLVQIFRVTSRTATEEEVEAWHNRCAARAALYDAKKAAYEEVNRTSGAEAAAQRLEDAYSVRDNLEDQIMEYRPRTLVGALEKMRFYREKDEDTFCADPDRLDWMARIFLSALEDIERLAGNSA